MSSSKIDDRGECHEVMKTGIHGRGSGEKKKRCVCASLR